MLAVESNTVHWLEKITKDAGENIMDFLPNKCTCGASTMSVIYAFGLVGKPRSPTFLEIKNGKRLNSHDEARAERIKRYSKARIVRFTNQ